MQQADYYVATVKKMNLISVLLSQIESEKTLSDPVTSAVIKSLGLLKDSVMMLLSAFDVEMKKPIETKQEIGIELKKQIVSSVGKKEEVSNEVCPENTLEKQNDSPGPKHSFLNSQKFDTNDVSVLVKKKEIPQTDRIIEKPIDVVCEVQCKEKIPTELAKVIKTKEILGEVSQSYLKMPFAEILIDEEIRNIDVNSLKKIISDKSSIIIFLRFENNRIIGIYFQKTIPPFGLDKISIEKDDAHFILGINTQDHIVLTKHTMPKQKNSFACIGGANDNFILDLNQVASWKNDGIWKQSSTNHISTKYKKLEELKDITGYEKGAEGKIVDVVILYMRKQQKTLQSINCSTLPSYENMEVKTKIEEVIKEEVKEETYEKEENELKTEEIKDIKDGTVEKKENVVEVQEKVQKQQSEKVLIINDKIISKQVIGRACSAVGISKLQILFDSSKNDLTEDSFWKSVCGHSKVIMMVEMDNGKMFGWYLDGKIPKYTVDGGIEIKNRNKHCFFVVNSDLNVVKYNGADSKHPILSYIKNEFRVFLTFNSAFQLRTSFNIKTDKKDAFELKYNDVPTLEEVCGVSPGGNANFKRLFVCKMGKQEGKENIKIIDLPKYEPTKIIKQEMKEQIKEEVKEEIKSKDLVELIFDTQIKKELENENQKLKLIYDSQELLSVDSFRKALCGKKQVFIIFQLENNIICGIYFGSVIPPINSKGELIVVEDFKHYLFIINKKKSFTKYKPTFDKKGIISAEKSEFNVLFRLDSIFEIRENGRFRVGDHEVLRKKYYSIGNCKEMFGVDNGCFAEVKRLIVCCLQEEIKSNGIYEEIRKEEITTIKKPVQLDELELLEFINSKEINEKLCNLTNNKATKVIYDSNSETKINVDKFWNTVIGKNRLFMMVQLENGKLFGWYLNGAIPQRQQNGSIEVMRDENHFFLVVSPKLKLTKFVAKKSTFPVISYEINTYKNLLKFNGVFELKTNKYFNLSKKEEIVVKYERITPMSKICQMENGTNQKFKRFIIVQMFEEQDIVETNEIKPTGGKEIVRECKEMSIDDRMEIFRKKKEEERKRVEESVCVEAKKENKLYETGMKMKIIKENQRIFCNYMVNTSDKILFALSKQENLIKFAELMNSGCFERIFSWKKGEGDLVINKQLLERNKINIFIETIYGSIFGCCACFENGKCCGAWFVSLINKTSGNVIVCEKKNLDNVFNVPKNHSNGLLSVEGLLGFGQTHIFIINDFCKYFKSEFDLNFYLNNGTNKTIEIKSVQIMSWD